MASSRSPPGRPRSTGEGQVHERRADEACQNPRCANPACWIEEAHITELTGLLREGFAATSSTAGQDDARLRPPRAARPGTQLSLFETAGGWRISSHDYGLNASWLDVAMTTCILLASLRLLALDGDLARAEPKTLRRLLHAADRLVRGGHLKIAVTWPWTEEITIAWQRIHAMPYPHDQPKSVHRAGKDQPETVEPPAAQPDNRAVMPRA